MTVSTEIAAYQDLQLEIDPDATYAEWEELLTALGAIAKSHQWWVGDAIVFGEAHYGEEHSQALEALGLEPKTAQNYAYVAANVDVSRRREDLSWSHHAEVARLSRMQQTTALERAVNEEWTVRQLRDYVAFKWPPPKQPTLPGSEPAEPSQRDDVDVQRKLEEIERRWSAVTLDKWRHYPRLTDEDLADVRFLLTVAKSATRSGA